MRGKISAIILTLLLVNTIQVLSLEVRGDDDERTRGNTLYVGAGENYSKINDALEYAISGDTIIVRPGMYKERVFLRKQISLIGSGPELTAITGGDSNTTIDIRSDGCRIVGINFTDPNTNGYGIITDSNDIQVENCTFYGNYVGFGAERTTNNITIVNCTFKKIETTAISFFLGNRITIKYCEIETKCEDCSSISLGPISNSRIMNTSIINHMGKNLGTNKCENLTIENITCIGRGLDFYSITKEQGSSIHIDDNTTVNGLPILYLCGEENIETNRTYSQAFIYFSKNVKIKEQRFNYTIPQVECFKSENLFFDNCHFEGGKSSILSSNSNDISITNCTFLENTYSSINLYSCNRGIISNCNLIRKKAESSAEFLVKLISSPNFEVCRSVFKGNDQEFVTAVSISNYNSKIHNLSIENLNTGLSINKMGHLIENCHISNVKVGLSLHSSGYNEINNIQIMDSEYGITLIRDSHVNIMKRCKIVNITKIGIDMSDSDFNQVIDVMIENCSEYGMRLMSSNSSIIMNSNFSNMVTGIALKDSNDNNMKYCTVRNTSLYAVEADADTSYNVFSNNTFINNSAANREIMKQGSDLGENSWDDGTKGNFWDTWDKPDLDKDGACDEPYKLDGVGLDRHPLKVKLGALRIITKDVLTANEDRDYSVQYKVENATGNQLSWSLKTNVEWLELDNNGRLFGTPKAGDEGFYDVRVVVSDGVNNDSSQFKLQVTDMNNNPVILPINDSTFMQDEEFEILVKCYDPDYEYERFEWTMTTAATFLNHRRTQSGLSITGTANSHQVGIYKINLTVEDRDGGTCSTEFNLTIQNVNDPPELEIVLYSISFKEDTESEYLNISSWFSDIDGDDLEYDITGLERITLIKHNEWNWSFLPPANWYGSEKVTITASDGEFMVDVDLILWVQSINDPPHSLRIEVDQMIEYKTHEFYFQGFCIDIEDDDLAFYWYTNRSSIELGRGFELSTFLDPGYHNISLKVVDQYGDSGWGYIHIRVLEDDEQLPGSNSDSDRIDDPETNEKKLNPGVLLFIFIIIVVIIASIAFQLIRRSSSKKTQEPPVTTMVAIIEE